MARVEFVPTTPEHIAQLATANIPFRVKAVTALVEGRVIGIGGIGFPVVGQPTAFACLTDEMRSHKTALHRIGLRCLREWHAAGIKQVIALADENIPAAERWLERYGFKAQESDGRKVFVLRFG